MTTNRRLSARVLAVVTILLAGCGPGSPIGNVETVDGPVGQVRTVEWVPPSPDWNDVIRWVHGVQDGRWYEWASQLPDPSPGRSWGRPAVNPGTVTDLSGDRFDRLAACESGGGVVENIDPAATDPTGQFLGAFQFVPSSDIGAGGDGDPRDESYEAQKAKAVYWASITNPARQWPVCWPRSA